MGIKGSKNTPITARISTGLFNQKKGVKEPLLNVGPAGVNGNNRTKDIPSPSKMRGYSMKASPAKQKSTDKEPEKPVGGTTKVGINVLKEVNVPDSKTEVNVPGEEKTRIKTGADVGVSQKEVNAYNMKTYGTHNPTKEGKTNNTTGTGEFKPDTKKEVVVKGKKSESNEFTANKTRDKGDAQTALERRNVIRSGKVAARTEKAAQRKIDRLNRKEDKINPDTKKAYDKKTQRLARKRTQAESNRKVSRNVMEGAKNQSAQNVGPRSDKGVLNAERNMTLSDVGGKPKQDDVIKSGGVSSSKSINFAEIGKTDDTSDAANFFKKKTPLKMKYFK